RRRPAPCRGSPGWWRRPGPARARARPRARSPAGGRGARLSRAARGPRASRAAGSFRPPWSAALAETWADMLARMRARRPTHGFRRGDLLHRLLDGTGRARPGAGGARLRVALGARALAYPALARLRVPGWRRAAQEVLRRDGSLRYPR